MDLSQTKLTKQEWLTTELPVTAQEKHVLQLIIQGAANPNVRVNLTPSLFTFMKIPTEERDNLELHLFDVFFRDFDKRSEPFAEGKRSEPFAEGKRSEPFAEGKRSEPFAEGKKEKKDKKKTPIKKADLIRIENMKANIELNRGSIFEFVLLGMVKRVRESLQKGTHEYAFCLYTLLQITKSAILHVNRYVTNVVRECVADAQKRMRLMDIVLNAEDYIEKNRYLGQYADMTLFSHQKDLFRLFSQNGGKPVGPTLVLYIAPTGTGKTLSPLGVAQSGKAVIFVCSARHVGLGLARAAVSVEKRVAFAYGCASAEDIRLHNYAAVDYVVNKRSGAIAKVDNTNGSRVEIMICDVRSYLVAMKYMLEFHTEDSLVLFWDEPTITMDYETHPLHPIIQANWRGNQISKVVLSCATLPREEELRTTLDNFRLKFAEYGELEPRIVPIVSYDFKKSITVLNAGGKAVLPHLLFPEFRDLVESVSHFRDNLTLLRYLDLGEVCRFIRTAAEPAEVAAHFGNDMSRVTMTSLKLYYLDLLEGMDEDEWPKMHTFFAQSQQAKFSKGADASDFKKSHSMPAFGSTPSVTVDRPICRTLSMASTPVTNVARDPFAGIQFTTEDAWTLTDGPTIYIAENVENMGLFYIKQTALPKAETDEIARKIAHNTVLQKRIDAIEKDLEDKKGKDADKEKKVEREHFSREAKELDGQLKLLKSQIESVRLRLDYVPNTAAHLDRFCKGPAGTGTAGTGTAAVGPVGKSYAPDIGEEDVIRIMLLDVDSYKKVLLLLGIGMFTLNAPTAYLELMKEFAAKQKLYMILASSDYIYGTNYAFCHGVVSKDLTAMTQQKTIQAMGRIGRNTVQQDYTVRFRNDAIIRALFLPPATKNLEAVNMCRLFSDAGF